MNAGADVRTVCPNCGDPIAPTDTFCECCGTQIGTPTETPAAAPDSGAEIGTQLLEPPRTADASTPTAAPINPSPPEQHCTCGGVIDADGWCTTCGLRAPSERDHFAEQPGEHVAAVCDRGIMHARNEDAVALAASGERTVIVVCDGVTSATDSDVASLAAARSARDVLAAAPASPTPSLDDRVDHWSAQLTRATAAAQTAAADAAAKVGPVENPPSCTYVAAVLDGRLLAVAWVGDSRAYWFGDNGVATQLSIDDSWASGAIAHGVSRKAAEADPRAHSITRWLGVDSPGGDGNFTSMTITGPGWVMVCTDGLWNYCSEATDLRDLLHDKARAAASDPRATADALVAWANDQGGHDNITAALARAGTTAPTTPTGSE